MDSIIRGCIVYLVLFVIFRISGNRTLAQTTSFDLVLLLIISETTQQAMVDDDHSMTNGLLLIFTLVGLSILFSHLKEWFPTFNKWANGVPVLIFDQGSFLEDRMKRARVDKEEILEAARMRQGLRSMDEVDYAILEPNGEITIIPKASAA
jgi:uncharacterized membrane protein YcaP (DUF421 family)